MYGFGEIKNIPVLEYMFKNGLAHSCMMFSDGNIDPEARQIIMIPGFHMNSKGEVLARKQAMVPDSVCFLPPKSGVEIQL